VREPGKLGEPSAGAKGRESSGKPESSNPEAKPEGEKCEATRNFTRRRNWKALPRGNPKQQRQRHRRTRNSGRLECSSPAQPEDAGTGATWRERQQAQPEYQAAEETPGLSAGGAEGSEIRGNLKIDRRQGRKMQKPGRPGGCIGKRSRRNEERGNPDFNRGGAEGREARKLDARSPAEPEDAGSGATRNLIERRDWKSRAARPERQTYRRMRESRQLETPSRAQP